MACSLSSNGTAPRDIPPDMLGRGEDEDGRLRKCWATWDCGSCLNNDAYCGWCPYSSACVPLPKSHPFPLIAPLRDSYAHICPFNPDRYELRTATLGCSVSTVLFMTCIVTILSTLAAIIVLWGAGTTLRKLWQAWKAARGGWEIVVVDEPGITGGGPFEGTKRVERVWVRKRAPGLPWWKFWQSYPDDDMIVGKEGMWKRVRGWLLRKEGRAREEGGSNEERAALLG